MTSSARCSASSFTPHALKLAGLGDLAGEPDAPGAHDAPVLVELDQGRYVLARVDLALFDESVH